MFNELGFDPDLVFRSMPAPSGLLRTMIPIKRVLPKIFIAGVQKSGTTSLFGLLTQHPSIALPQLKEPFFFGNDDRYPEFLSTYRKNFPPRLKMNYLRRKTGSAETIDATTNYFDHPKAAERIKQHIPDAKVIIMLRNPVERAFSQYKMAVRNRIEGLSFEAALEKENERIASAESRPHNYCRQRLGYRSRGEYALMMEPWMKTFGKNLLVLKAETFFQDEKNEFQRVLEFLGLPAFTPEDFTPLNQDKSHEALNTDTRLQLETHFRPWNEKLEEMVQQKFNWS